MSIWTTSDKYLVRYTGGNSASSRRDTLADGGPLVVRAAHFLVTAIPHELEDEGNGDWGFTQHLMEHIGLDVLEWTAELKRRNMLWTLQATRFSRLIARLDATGSLQWRLFTRVEDLIEHLFVLLVQLPEAERQVGISDVTAYTVPAVPTTLMEMLKPAAVFKGGRSTIAVDIKSAYSDGYVAARRNDAAGHFAAISAVVLHAAVKDSASAPLPVQCNDILAFFEKSQPATRALRRYVPWDRQGQEISRRSLTSPSERFIPLLISAFDDKGDAGYAEFKLAFPHACNGESMVAMIQLMATRAGKSEELTAAICSALCQMLRDGALAAVDTAAHRAASNADRNRYIGDHLATAAISRKDSSADGSSELETFRKLHVVVELKRDLEALDTSPRDYAAIVTRLAREAMGRIYLATGVALDPLLKKFAGARVPDEIKSSLNKALAFDLDMNPIEAEVCTADVAIALIKGKYDHASMDLWNHLVKPVIIKRDGKEAARKESDDPDTFWSDHSRLCKSEPILYGSLDWVGRSGRHVHGFRSFYDSQKRRAYAVNNLPDYIVAKPGLIKDANKIGQMAMDFGASKDATMFQEGIRAVIELEFCPASSPAGLKMVTFETQLLKAQEKVRTVDEYGDSDADEYTTALVPAKRKVDDGSYPLDTYWHNTDHTWGREKLDKSVGYQLTRYSVYLTDAGLLFGMRYLVQLTSSNYSKLLEAKPCIGQVCYLKEARRGDWCSVKKGCAAHPRPDGFADGDFVCVDCWASDLDATLAGTLKTVWDSMSTWQHVGGTKDKTSVLGFPQAGGMGSSSSSRGRGGRGTGDRGGRRNSSWSPSIAKGNRGKGKGGKGKGKGGKSKPNKGKPTPNFGRLR